MVIKPDGKVGIGTTTPSEKLAVAGNSVTTGSATVGSLVVGTSPILSVGKFEKTEPLIAGSGNAIAVAHGLGGVPTFSTVSLRCISAEFGWSVGDEIMINSIHMRSDNHGFTLAANATHLKIRYTNSIWIHNYDALGSNPITMTKWILVFRAWR
ncbi:MAG: hypothetical protein ACAH89_12045 [Rariglobus sp.]